MKILMVTMSMDLGGAETHILELSKGLQKRGVTVHVASAGGVFTKKLEEAGIPHFTLPLNRRKLSAMMQAKAGLEKLIVREKYDVVHAHARIPAFLCGKLYDKYHFRFVTTCHTDFEITPLLRKLTDWGEHTIAVSEDLKQYVLREYPVNPDRMSLTVNGIDTDFFAPTPKEEHDRPVIVHISRLGNKVSHLANVLMDAVFQMNGAISLIVVGDGEARPMLQEKGKEISDKLGRQAITYVGGTPDVKPYLAKADIVVSPSRTAMEGMAMGIPTIVSGSQGHGGIFRESLAKDCYDTNFCFRDCPLPTADILQKEIQEILDMPKEERETLGHYGRTYIEKYYSVSRMVESQLRVYENMVQYTTHGDPDILLCGYYGFGNLGDETLLSVIVEELRKRKPDIKITVLTANPRETARYHMVDTVERFDFLPIHALMKRTKLFLFGGGSLLQDKTSTRSLAYYESMLCMAKKQGMTTYVFANGIGPILKPKNKNRVKAALTAADFLSFRDSLSLETAASYGKKGRLTFDPAILLSKGESVKKEDFFLVVAKKGEETASETLTKWIKTTAETYRLRPMILSLFDRQDKEFALSLAEKTGAQTVSLLDCHMAIRYMQKARFVLSGRLHGLVYATVAACPMLAFSDDPKLLSYMDMLGFSEKDGWGLGCTTDSSAAVLTEKTEKILQKEEEIRKEIEEKLPRFRELAAREFDEVINLVNS